MYSVSSFQSGHVVVYDLLYFSVIILFNKYLLYIFSVPSSVPNALRVNKKNEGLVVFSCISHFTSTRLVIAPHSSNSDVYACASEPLIYRKKNLGWLAGAPPVSRINIPGIPCAFIF